MRKTSFVLLMVIVALAMAVLPAYACPNWRRYDLNHDSRVDIHDINIVVKAYGSYKGQTRYFPRLDFNHDKYINIFDIVTIIRYYGSGKP